MTRLWFKNIEWHNFYKKNCICSRWILHNARYLQYAVYWLLQHLNGWFHLHTNVTLVHTVDLIFTQSLHEPSAASGWLSGLKKSTNASKKNSSQLKSIFSNQLRRWFDASCWKSIKCSHLSETHAQSGLPPMFNYVSVKIAFPICLW